MSAPRFKHCDIRIGVDLAAPPERVFSCLTSARELCAWWLERAETEARNAGRLRMVWPSASASPLREARGQFVDLEPGRKAAWLWGSSKPATAAPPLVNFFLEGQGRGRCRVTLLHAGFSAAASQRRHLGLWRQHWEDCLAKLSLYLEAGKICKGDHLSLAELSMLQKADGARKPRAPK